MFAIILRFRMCHLIDELVCTVKVLLSEAYTNREIYCWMESGMSGPVRRRFGPSFVDNVT
jgi:hypothetical protein